MDGVSVVPDIPNRDELERKIARLLGKYNRQQLAELMKLMKNHPTLANVPAEFWTTSQMELVQTLMPFSEMVYMEAAARMVEAIPVGVDWALVNTAAADWARSYSTILAGQINATSRSSIATSIRNSIASFFEDSMTFGELEERLRTDRVLRDLFTSDVRDRLGRIYGPQRAAMIARTEVTRAAVEGERATVREIEKEGIRMVEVWQTRNDEIVCPICGPRHNVQERKGAGDAYWDRNMGPPAHPRCRCWTNHEFEKPREE